MMLSKINAKKIILPITLVLLMFSSNLLAQQYNSVEGTQDVATAVYKEVWLPFMESYRALDVEKFKSIHSEDLTRVSIDQNRIQNSTEYFTQYTALFMQLKGVGQQIDIKFSIMSTATDGNKVYQTGYYCFSMRASDSEEFKPQGYGFFNVLLQKENGLWKVLLDADKQVSITHEEFEKAGVVYGLE